MFFQPLGKRGVVRGGGNRSPIDGLVDYFDVPAVSEIQDAIEARFGGHHADHTVLAADFASWSYLFVHVDARGALPYSGLAAEHVAAVTLEVVSQMGGKHARLLVEQLSAVRPPLADTTEHVVALPEDLPVVFVPIGAPTPAEILAECVAIRSTWSIERLIAKGWTQESGDTHPKAGAGSTAATSTPRGGSDRSGKSRRTPARKGKTAASKKRHPIFAK